MGVSLPLIPDAQCIVSYIRARVMITKLDTNKKDVYKDLAGKEGLLSKEKVAQAVRCLGHNPLNQEVNALTRKYKGKYLNYPQFEEVLKEVTKLTKPIKDEVSESLDIFDVDGEGLISRGHMKHLLCTKTGEGLTEEEFEDLLDNIPPNEDGMIRVTDFAHLLTFGGLPTVTNL